MTRKLTARPRELSLGTVREFERDQLVLTRQTLAKARRVRVAQLLPSTAQQVGRWNTARSLHSVA